MSCVNFRIEWEYHFYSWCGSLLPSCRLHVEPVERVGSMFQNLRRRQQDPYQNPERTTLRGTRMLRISNLIHNMQHQQLLRWVNYQFCTWNCTLIPSKVQNQKFYAKTHLCLLIMVTVLFAQRWQEIVSNPTLLHSSRLHPNYWIGQCCPCCKHRSNSQPNQTLHGQSPQLPTINPCCGGDNIRYVSEGKNIQGLVKKGAWG